MDDVLFSEESLCALEKRIGLTLTVIDHDGLFNRKQRVRVFSPERSSHKKNAVCRIGFCGKCIAHCRYAMNERCIETENPFLSSCWKGVSQIVVPLKFNSVHYGMLYAGMFRESDSVPDENLPTEFISAFESLPSGKSLLLEELIPLLRIFGDGILFYLRRRNLVNDEYDLRSMKIFDFMQRHLSENQGLSALAFELNLSESHTSVLVRKLFGLTFSRLQMRFRTERAERYLLSTDLPLSKIADLCGFSSEFHLSKVFHLLKGVPPGVYRLQNVSNSLTCPSPSF